MSDNTKKLDTKFKVLNKEEKENSIVELSVEIEKSFLDSYSESSIKDLGEEIEIDGFRKGKAPADKVKEKVGEMKIYEKNLFKAINQIVPLVLAQEELNVITMPNIEVTKIAVGQNPEIKITATLMPKIELADYKKIAKDTPKEKAEEVTEKEVEEYIEYIRKQRAGQPKEGEEQKLPEVNDEFVKSLGDFKDVEDFKTKLKENMSKDKEVQASQKRRVAIIEKIIADSKIDLPEVLVEEELNKMVHEFKSKVEGFKMDFDEYLKELKKTEDDLRNEWKADSAKRAKMNLILPRIAKEENIKPDEKAVEKEVKHLKENHKDVNEAQAKVYVASVLTNDEVFKYLEKL